MQQYDLWGNGSSAPIFYDDMVLVDITPCHGDLDGDLDGDNVVGFSDVLVVLSKWGICP